MLRRTALRLVIATIVTLPLVASGNAVTPPAITIAMVAPLTGTLSAVRAGHRAGAEAAVRALNRQGGVGGRRIVLRVFDDASNPTQAVIRTQELAADSRVVAMIGSGFSGSAVATAPIATRARLPYVSVAPLHSLVYPPRPFVYATGHTTRVVAYKLAAHLRATGVRRLALLRANTSIGAEAAQVVSELARRYGIEVVEEQVYPLTSTTFVADLVRIKHSSAQAVWVWGVDVSAVTITKEYRQLRLPQRLVLSHGVASPLYLRPACPEANGATLAAPWSVVARTLPDSNPSKRVTLRINRLVGSNASIFSYAGHSAVAMIAQAIRTHGIGREAINSALERMTFVGPDGRYRFSRLKHTGLTSKSLLLMRVKNCALFPLPGQDLDG
jgi:branched-chain amino acid transport system substrate-binding protein